MIQHGAHFSSASSGAEGTDNFGLRLSMLMQELHEKRVTLIEGTALSERDLVRARAESTGAILLLADRFSADAKQEDLSVQFQARAPQHQWG